MSTEKSIKWLKKRRIDDDILKSMIYYNTPFKAWNEQIDEIINRLQMWDEFKKRGFNERFLKLNDDCTMSKFKIDTYMDNFEEKYISKPDIRRTIEVEVLASNREVINELEKEIDEMNGRIFNKGKIRIVSTRWARDKLKEVK